MSLPPFFFPPWDHKEYWIFCDESVSEGRLYSDFFGGMIIPASIGREVEIRLRAIKAENGLIREVKWTKVDPDCIERYKALITAFFEELRNCQLRVRILFRANDGARRTRQEIDDRYYKLYYQFIKHSFGLHHIPCVGTGTRMRIYLDQFPFGRTRFLAFRQFIRNLPKHGLGSPHLLLDSEHVTEIDSKKCVMLQCVDVLLGAMAFALNEHHLVPPKGGNPAGKKTLAKLQMISHIVSEIKTMEPRFKMGTKSPCSPYPEGQWSMAFRQWPFVSRVN